MPTVVPWRSVKFSATPIFSSASAIAREGSSGVENTFKVLSALPAAHTQSVKVPPVSIAMRISRRAARAMNRGRVSDAALGPHCSGGTLLSQVVIALTCARTTPSAYEQNERTPVWFGTVGAPMIW